MVRRRYRLWFNKTGNLRFIGHRDLLRAMERLLSRAGLLVAKSQGFHPKPKVSYISALPLGFSSDDEAMELVLEEELAPEALLARLNVSSVEGLEFLRAVTLDDKEPKASAEAFSYEMGVPEIHRASVRRKIAQFFASSSVEVVKTNGKTVDARACVKEMDLQDECLRMTLYERQGPEAGVREILNWLGLGSELFRSVFPNRCKTWIKSV